MNRTHASVCACIQPSMAAQSSILLQIQYHTTRPVRACFIPHGGHAHPIAPRVARAQPLYVSPLALMLALFFCTLLAVANGLSADVANLNAFRSFLSNPDKGVLTTAPAVKIKESANQGRGLVAIREVEAGDELLAVPQDLGLCPSSFLTAISKTGDVGAQLADAGKALMESPEGASCLLALAILYEESLGDASPIAPYLAILPSPTAIAHPLLWEDEYCAKLLQGSHLVERLARLRSDLRDEFSGLSADVFERDRATFPADAFTPERYLWAHALVLSRSLPVGEDPDGAELSLVPLLDLANHEAGSPHSWDVSDEATGQVRLVAGAKVRAGDPVVIDYTRGVRRATWEFYYSYGCVPSVNLPEEAAAAHWLEAGGRPLQVQPFETDDPLLLQKRALLVALGADETVVEEGVEVNLTPDTPSEMAPFLRLGLASDANAPDLAESLAGWKADPTEVWTKLQQPISPDLESAVTAKVLAQIGATLAPLPPSVPMAMAAARDAPTEESARERAAARVLLGERHALEACRDWWKMMEEALAAS